MDAMRLSFYDENNFGPGRADKKMKIKNESF